MTFGMRAVLMIAALSVAAAAPILTPVDEQRAQALMRELACPVCAGQPIAESDAPVAEEMRARVRAAVAAGDTNSEIRTAMAASYGPGVLLRPAASGAGLILWLAPILVFAAAVIVFARAVLGSRGARKS